MVVVDEPAGEFYGGAIAAPVFKEIATQSLAYLEIFPKGLGTTTQAWGTQVKGVAGYSNDILTQSLYIAQNEQDSLDEEREDFSHMPDLRGKTVRSVLRLAREIPLEVKISGSGKAVYQKPSVGERIAQGASAEVWFK